LGDVFGMTIEEVKEKLEIEPPFYVDYVCLFSQISRAMLRLLGHKYNVRRSLLCQYGPNHPRRRTC
jgi:hypothetical protein